MIIISVQAPTMLTLPGITLQWMQILQPHSAALMVKLYHLMSGCFIFSGLQPPPVSYSLICLSVLSSTVHICKISLARQSCLPSAFYNQTIKTNSHNLTTYKRDNSYSFPIQHLKHKHMKMKFPLNSLSGTADGKLHAGLFSQSQPSTLSSRPCSFGKFNNNN